MSYNHLTINRRSQLEELPSSKVKYYSRKITTALQIHNSTTIHELKHCNDAYSATIAHKEYIQ